jgi:hypothetical protein
MFPEYKKYPYKVKFNTDNVFYLGGNQRTKLQYHILAQHFDLVEVDEQDKDDLREFCFYHDGETASRWLNRMKWEHGHEKMITFGVASEVRGAAKGVWCYSANLTPIKAEYSGRIMRWEQWLGRVIGEMEFAINDAKNRNKNTSAATYRAIEALYYQDGRYLTLPAETGDTIKKWIFDCYKEWPKGSNDFQYNGEMPNTDLKFTIDFENDIEIVRTYDLKDPVQMAEHNKEMGRNQTKNRFEQLKGDKWTTQEIHAQGFSRKTLDKFVKHGLIKRIKQGHYVRNSV